MFKVSIYINLSRYKRRWDWKRYGNIGRQLALAPKRKQGAQLGVSGVQIRVVVGQ
jgi:hypothetical protein